MEEIGFPKRRETAVPMPVLVTSTYRAPRFFKNGHIQTIYPSLLRRLVSPEYARERIVTPDDDFLDLDWSKTGSSKLAVISHGLEGNSHRKYVMGMVSALNAAGWDALAWNFRSCSGEPNRRLRFYHSGEIEDLTCVLTHVNRRAEYDRIALIGFSMGGNITLVYLGTRGKDIPGNLEKAVVFSVPCDLAASSVELSRFHCKLYLNRFLRMLHDKIRAKMAVMPGQIDDEDFHLIKDFRTYDDRYTAPLHGFNDAEDYYRRCSSNQFIPDICIPTLIVNAKNDPFLAGDCYPEKAVSLSGKVYLEIPSSGGHVGFMSYDSGKRYWSEKRVLGFLADGQNNSSNTREAF
jgi:uncharacterized protein